MYLGHYFYKAKNSLFAILFFLLIKLRLAPLSVQRKVNGEITLFVPYCS